MFTLSLRRLVAPSSIATFVKKAHVCLAIDRCHCEKMSEGAFINMCISAGSAGETMNEQEAKNFLQQLHEARIVIYSPAHQLVFLQPQKIVDTVHSKLGLAPLTSFRKDEIAQAADLEHSIARKDSKATSAFEKVAIWRRKFWTSVAIGSGTQMAVLAYLTFVKFDWDVMEPVSFFVTAFSAIFLYAYFLISKKELAYEDIDNKLLPKQLKERCQECSIDLDVWLEELKKESVEKSE